MNTEIANAITATNDKAQYDEKAKRLLAEKHILAHILVNVVEEFKGMNPNEVVSYIEGEPYISSVPIEPGLTNVEKEYHFGDLGVDFRTGNTERMNVPDGERVVGLNTENQEVNEGMIRFDIIFYVRRKRGLAQIIVNVEAQKDEPTEYRILNRAIFYVSRLISSQKERDFVNTNYDDIKQVVSIWICMNRNANSLSHIHLTKEELLEPYDWKGDIGLLNIAMIGLTNDLPDYDDRYELHRLLSALLSEKLNTKEKLEIIENEYKIPMNENFRRDVNVMCNLGEGIEERAEAQSFATVIMNMYRNNFNLEQIVIATGKTLEDVKAIIEKNTSALV